MKLIYVYILIFAFFGCSAVSARAAVDELDPTSLLTADCEKISSPDIQMPPIAEQTIFNSPVSIINQATNFAAAVKTELPADSNPQHKDDGLLRLRKSNISPPAKPGDNEKSSDLKLIIEQIRTMSFEPKQPEGGGQKTEDREQKTEEIQKTQEQAPSETQILEELLKDPNHITTPLELAEVLFKSGRIYPAGLCYKQALLSMDANDANKAEQRAWILFQIGNCLKYKDPNTARDSFAELVRTQPNSNWAQIAKTEHDLVEWYLQESPKKLIEELKR